MNKVKKYKVSPVIERVCLEQIKLKRFEDGKDALDWIDDAAHFLKYHQLTDKERLLLFKKKTWRGEY